MDFRTFQLLMVVSFLLLGRCNGCEFDNEDYPEGSTIPHTCVSLKCENGNWVLDDNGAIDGDCGLCSLSDDPHITTFDGYYYHWHGTCQYSIAQYKFSQDPPYGIYGKFSECDDLWNWGPNNGIVNPSCSDVTTFMNDPDTVIRLYKFEDNKVSVNGDDVPVSPFPEVIMTNGDPHGVIAWTDDDDCIMVVGSHGLMLQKCHGVLSVWAYPSLKYSINGLCGHYNDIEADDFTTRSGVILNPNPTPVDFPESWETEDQPNQDCESVTFPPPPGRLRHIIPPHWPPACSQIPFYKVHQIEKKCDEFERFFENGKDHLNALIKNQIKSCVADLCMIKAMGYDHSVIDSWWDEMLVIIKIIIHNAHKTYGSKPPYHEHDEHGSEHYPEHHGERPYNEHDEHGSEHYPEHEHGERPYNEHDEHGSEHYPEHEHGEEPYNEHYSESGSESLFGEACDGDDCGPLSVRMNQILDLNMP